MSGPGQVAPVHVDARGLRCPWPVLRLAKALREGAAAVELLTDDPAAAVEVASFAAERGLALTVVEGRYLVGNIQSS
ncbi:MAG: sulfurtransferase TusA family protein [Janthinobacterium lividum]